MLVKVTGRFGEPAGQAAYERLRNILQGLHVGVAKPMQEGLLGAVRAHFKKRFPGSENYSPDKVYPYEADNGLHPAASIYITAPGVGRAYHDENIKPKTRKYLAIPMRREAFGRKPRDFQGAFAVETKNNSLLLAKKAGNGL